MHPACPLLSVEYRADWVCAHDGLQASERTVRAVDLYAVGLLQDETLAAAIGDSR